eukprot:2320142-Pleurochrysis_carterae.AAC.1
MTDWSKYILTAQPMRGLVRRFREALARLGIAGGCGGAALLQQCHPCVACRKPGPVTCTKICVIKDPSP